MNLALPKLQTAIDFGYPGPWELAYRKDRKPKLVWWTACGMSPSPFGEEILALAMEAVD